MALSAALREDLTDRKPSNGSRSRRAMARRGRWAFQRSRIEPIFETGFRDESFGFRPGRGCHDALREVDRLIKEGYAYAADADLAGYFDSIPHDRLMARVEAKVSDGRVLDLIRGWLKAHILKGL
jgi:retron-type reverse transcriptase